jgi:LmbE family N-acetylglucosaminyl deacetylase
VQVLLSPHNDDESLFAAYTIMPEKPLVIIVTDSNLQEGVTAQVRREETMRACKILGVPVEFLGLEDGSLGELDLTREMQSLNTQHWEHVYAPAIQSGHCDHDVVGRVASRLFPSTKYYSTYTKDNYDPFGQHSITGSQHEIAHCP